MPADLLAALTTAAGLARTANDTGQSLSRREHGRDRLHAWTDDHPWMFADVVERVRELEDECGRLRKELKDYMDAASVEAFEGDLARKDAASLAAELAEAVEALVPFADANGHIRSGTGETVTVRIAVQRSDHDDISYRLITRDFRAAAAIVAKHKGNAS